MIPFLRPSMYGRVRYLRWHFLLFLLLSFSFLCFSSLPLFDHGIQAMTPGPYVLKRYLGARKSISMWRLRCSYVPRVMALIGT